MCCWNRPWWPRPCSAVTGGHLDRQRAYRGRFGPAGTRHRAAARGPVSGADVPGLGTTQPFALLSRSHNTAVDPIHSPVSRCVQPVLRPRQPTPPGPCQDVRRRARRCTVGEVTLGFPLSADMSRQQSRDVLVETDAGSGSPSGGQFFQLLSPAQGEVVMTAVSAEWPPRWGRCQSDARLLAGQHDFVFQVVNLAGPVRHPDPVPDRQLHLFETALLSASKNMLRRTNFS
jgi:hypothetical protein